mmetsp:Transcript_3599/g.7866  ORF Transcript_3599/g.7866 Transcript_3599/m.7866 type:complete len:509 (-) Transcript_3599:60-1586(-)|eukprot:CAMPEP_0201120984 /NCGR_PEP_ID=MMETSP0850-20130426/4947_1 /ASSEMBLY_ACC=CAM_ASM_000622 /TAXON_ID=183588 /ORGANISM="Pseudo-nitzschia fraudulenta, Strain WWA7" /LENGTH=508 /DNA_ID=CAMNT_0047387295 /DNA_START=132 /DNA_END=1658 /DNA_ORIENTATION=+
MANDECDYLVIGGGATGMAFSDTLLGNSRGLRVIVVDKHDAPGGQWNDSYDFVRLHQPSAMYGVESKKLEAIAGDDERSSHRATRSEILEYYAGVRRDLETNHDFEYFGGTTLDLAQLYDGNPSRQDYAITDDKTGVSRTIRVRKRLVDARNLEPDLPVSTPPKFGYPKDAVSVQPVNDIATSDAAAEKKHFVVVGGGKTGMDAVYYLLTEKDVTPENILWVVPNDAWITARENIGNCIDLLYTSAKLHEDSSSSNDGNTDDEKKDTDAKATTTPIGSDFFQRGFVEWEKQGHIYRLDSSIVPHKFKDATLSREELGVLQTVVPRMVRAGRISEITDTGSMVFKDGSTMDLPFASVADTLFLHCSAGAFHCTKSNKTPPPIFEEHRIVVQDIYGTPGFCFVGSMLGKLESTSGLSDEERNQMCQTPRVSPAAPTEEVSGGDVIGSVSRDHPFVQRAHNLRMWMDRPELRRWVFESRLFHLGGADPDTVSEKVDYVFKVLKDNGIAMDN